MKLLTAKINTNNCGDLFSCTLNVGRNCIYFTTRIRMGKIALGIHIFTKITNVL